jgi:hypothetical protein
MNSPMNDFNPNDKERLENWKALQIALGLVPEETPVPVGQATGGPPAPSQPERAVPAPAPDVDSEIELADSIEAVELTPAVPPEPAGAEQDVEVGEAPEEVPEEAPDEATAQGGKRRRRRRRRRRGDEAPGGDRPAPAETQPRSDRPAAPQPVELAGPGSAADDDELEDEADDGTVLDDDEEIEPLSIPDWNVPTWQELIASLYRPER